MNVHKTSKNICENNLSDLTIMDGHFNFLHHVYLLHERKNFYLTHVSDRDYCWCSVTKLCHNPNRDYYLHFRDDETEAHVTHP